MKLVLSKMKVHHPVYDIDKNIKRESEIMIMYDNDKGKKYWGRVGGAKPTGS